MKDWTPLGNHWWQCLEDGDWVVTFLTHINTSVNTGGWWEMKLNGVNVAQLYGEDTDYNRMHIQASFHATRGDLLWIHGTVSSASHWQIDRL